MLRRSLFTMAGAALAAATFAPAAHAWTTFSFSSQTGSASLVEVSTTTLHTRLEVARGASIVAQANIDSLTFPNLQAGDIANLYDGTALVASATYDGLPKATGVCVGHTSFGATRGATANVIDAGAFRPLAGSIDWVDAGWTVDESALVTLERPLVAGDFAYVKTSAVSGTTETRSSRGEPALDCQSNRPPDEIAPPTTPVPPRTPTIPPSALTPTTAQVSQMVKAALSVAGTTLRTRTARSLARSSAVALPFAFSEPGRVDLTLTANGTVIGTGAKTSASNGKTIVSVALTPAGRKLLKRGKPLKITVKAVFAATRNGAETSKASVTVTIRR